MNRCFLNILGIWEIVSKTTNGDTALVRIAEKMLARILLTTNL
ncbi:unnamed protein product, partial [Rotaria magnacalcarata]